MRGVSVMGGMNLMSVMSVKCHCVIKDFCIRSLWVIITEIGHAHHGVHLAHDVHPLLHLNHISILPFQELANEEKVAQHEGIGKEQPQEIAATVIPLQDFLQLGEGRQGISQLCLHLPPHLALEVATRYQLKNLGISHELMTKFSAAIIYLIQRSLANRKHNNKLHHHPRQSYIGRYHTQNC